MTVTKREVKEKQKGSAPFNEYLAHFDLLPGMRSIIHIQVQRISDSCGYGVPRFEFKGQRSALVKWTQSRSEESLRDYEREHNPRSLDGLSGVQLEAKV